MKIKRGFKNLVYGFIGQFFAIALGILIPRLFLVNFGSEVNGFLTSISQIFMYLGLLEAGVGAATIQALYRPSSQNNKYEINGILAATSIYYKRIGLYYFIAVICLSIIYPLLIHTSINKTVVAMVILLTGMGGVINFFFQAKFKLLMRAEGKNYINININTFVTIFGNISKVVLLLLGSNIIIIQASFLGISILQMLIMWFYIKRHYKWIDLKVLPNFKAISQKSAALVHEVSGMILNSTDVLILTIFCNLEVVSVYVIYNIILAMISMAMNTVNNSILFILGHYYHENFQKFIKLHNSFEIYYMSVMFALYTVAFICILPFMRLYTEGINDINYIDSWLSILFVTIGLLNCLRIPGLNAIGIAGHFKKTQNRAIIEALINIICSLVFVNLFGIYGVLIGTICALIYRVTDIIIYSNTIIMKQNPWVTVKRGGINVVLYFLIILIVNEMKINPLTYIQMATTGFVLTIIIGPIYLIVNSLFNKNDFKYILSCLRPYIDSYLKGKKT